MKIANRINVGLFFIILLTFSASLSAQQQQEGTVRLWPLLDGYSQADRENASMRFVMPETTPQDLLAELRHIEDAWEKGRYAEAITLLRGLEESGRGGTDLAIGTSWMVPKAAPGTPTGWGTGTVITTRAVVHDPCLEFHAASGNLFAVVQHMHSGSYGYSFHVSTDDGQTWTETYDFSASYPVLCIDAAIIEGMFGLDKVFVGFPLGSAQTEAFIDHFYADFGTRYSSNSVIDKGAKIRQIDLSSNADTANDIVWYNLLTESEIYSLQGNSMGLYWVESSTGASASDYHEFDACFNEGFGRYFNWICYRTTSNICVLRQDSAGWNSITLPVKGNRIGISAYQDTIAVVYSEFNKYIRCALSNDGGDNWIYETIGTQNNSNYAYDQPSITARKGGGLNVVWLKRLVSGGGVVTAYSKFRDYIWPSWSEREFVTDSNLDFERVSLEWVPPSGGSSHAYGAVYHDGSTARFIRNDAPHHGATVDIKCNDGDANVTVPVGTKAEVTYAIYAGTDAGLPVDVWLVINSPFGFYSFDGVNWVPGYSTPFYMGALKNLEGTCLYRTLPNGAYVAFAGIDDIQNGILDLPPMLLDKVDFHTP